MVFDRNVGLLLQGPNLARTATEKAELASSGLDEFEVDVHLVVGKPFDLASAQNLTEMHPMSH
jgi:hypothetical protein